MDGTTVSRAIVIVGPSALRGPYPVANDLVAAALAGIDDDLALVDERVVAVDQVWRDVFGAALAGRCDDVTLVVPSWWAGSRVARVTAAARAHAANVTVQQRVSAWMSEATVVELAAEIVIVHADTQRHAISRLGAAAAVVDAVGACVAGLRAVTVDVPSGSGLFGAELVHGLRRTGITVAAVDDRALERALAERREHVEPGRWRRTIPPRVAVLAGAALTVTTLGAAAGLLDSGPNPATEGGTWLVEGRVAVEIPAHWTVERVTSGPGSARVQVHSPTDRFAAIQVTQSRVSDAQTLEATAEALRLALADEPDGIFVDFTADGRRAERAVVTYRELRADHHVAWAVMLDRGIRIAIGCQGAPDGVGPEQACDRAIRSARAVT